MGMWVWISLSQNTGICFFVFISSSKRARLSLFSSEPAGFTKPVLVLSNWRGRWSAWFLWYRARRDQTHGGVIQELWQTRQCRWLQKGRQVSCAQACHPGNPKSFSWLCPCFKSLDLSVLYCTLRRWKLLEEKVVNLCVIVCQTGRCEETSSTQIAACWIQNSLSSKRAEEIQFLSF